MKQFEAHARWAFTLVAFFGCVSCATQTSYDTTAQRPPLVLVYDFHASPNTAFENSRLIAQGTSDFSSASTEARQAALGELVRKRIREKLVDGINGMGLPTRWGDPSTPAPIGTLVIRGDWAGTLIYGWCRC